MRTNQSIKIGPLRKNEVADADQIVRIAFGTFLGLPNPLEFMGDRSFILPRSLSTNVTILAARENGRQSAEYAKTCVAVTGPTLPPRRVK